MPYTILLVDDDRDFRTEFRDYFEGYTIIEARDGEEALRILKQPNEIDLAVLDVVMPGQRGTVVLKEIKRQAPGLGIVMMTGHSTKDVAVEALKGRADDYLEKPLDPAEAKEVIDRLLAAREGGGEISEQGIEGRIERVKRFVMRNCHRKVSLADAAAAACVSAKYLSRVFKERTKQGFNEFYLRAKIERAKELLRDTRMTVEQVSDKVGYRNAESFIRIFRKIAGNTPAGYRGSAARAKRPKTKKAARRSPRPKAKKAARGRRR